MHIFVKIAQFISSKTKALNPSFWLFSCLIVLCESEKLWPLEIWNLPFGQLLCALANFGI